MPVDGGGLGIIEFANFSKLATMLLEVFSKDVTMLLANSAPGMIGGGPDLVVVGLGL